jgi:hypothetical protein
MSRQAYEVVVMRGGSILRSDTINEFIRQSGEDIQAPFIYNELGSRDDPASTPSTAWYWADPLRTMFGKKYNVTVRASQLDDHGRNSYPALTKAALDRKARSLFP